MIYFESVNFTLPELTVFDDFDLTNVSFVYTDISEIEIGERTRWKANKKLLDERRADHGEIPYENVATVYRRLRQNFESRLRYSEAGRFFVAEMNVRRKNIRVKNRVFRWLRQNVFSALGWYGYFSSYGEDYFRILLWIISVPILAAFLTTIAATQPLCIDQLRLSFQTNLQNYILAFFQLKTENMAQLAVRLLSLLLMGQLYIAL